jgi:RNA polymerase sigma factor (sigma-70 family)
MHTMAQQQGIIQAIAAYGRQLFSFIRSRVPNNEEAEDILQDVWFQLSNQPQLEAIESMSGWLYRVARNRIIDKKRRAGRVAIDSLDVHEDGDDAFWLPAFLQQQDGDPATEQLRQIFWDTLAEALEELPEKQRTVFVQNELEDVTLREIAEKEGENIKTIISRKRYAVQHLRHRLKDVYNEFFNI